MASEQVMLRLLFLASGVLLLAFVAGCGKPRPAVLPAPRLLSPYGERQVWAVAPLRNESGSLQADGVKMADRIAQQLERVDGIDVLPVSRVLAALQSMGLDGGVSSPSDAMRLRQVLGVEGLVVGSLSAFDPYDPPKIGLSLELYSAPHRPEPTFSIRELSRAGVEDAARPPDRVATGQPVSVVSLHFDAADPETNSLLRQYAVGRGRETAAYGLTDERLYRISMDLYTEFVSYAASSRLLRAEKVRVRQNSRDPLS